MAGSTQKLNELRPVSFPPEERPKGAVQYGLIARRSTRWFPELVIRDEAGTIQGVRYDETRADAAHEVQQEELKESTLRRRPMRIRRPRSVT